MALKKGAKKIKAAKPARSTVKKTAKKAVKRSDALKSTVKKNTARKAAGKVAIKTAKTTVKPASSAMTARPNRRISLAERKRNELLKKILLKIRNQVVEGLETQIGRKLVRETGQKIDSAMDSADQSALDMDQGIDYSLLEMKYEQYKDIADAFRKLQSNTYGQCEECDEEIDLKRLAVNPLARYCVACKTNKEKLENIQKEETRFKE